MPLTPTPQLIGDGPTIGHRPIQVECVFRQDTGIEHEAMPADPTDTPVGRRLHVSHAEGPYREGGAASPASATGWEAHTAASGELFGQTQPKGVALLSRVRGLPPMNVSTANFDMQCRRLRH
jgi:hypothetical protein